MDFFFEKKGSDSSTGSAKCWHGFYQPIGSITVPIKIEEDKLELPKCKFTWSWLLSQISGLEYKKDSKLVRKLKERNEAIYKDVMVGIIVYACFVRHTHCMHGGCM